MTFKNRDYAKLIDFDVAGNNTIISITVSPNKISKLVKTNPLFVKSNGENIHKIETQIIQGDKPYTVTKVCNGIDKEYYAIYTRCAIFIFRRFEIAEMYIERINNNKDDSWLEFIESIAKKYPEEMI